MSNDYSPTVYNKAFEVKYRHKNVNYKLKPHSIYNPHVLKFVDPSEESKIDSQPIITAPIQQNSNLELSQNTTGFIRESRLYTDYMSNRLSELRTIVANRVQNELTSLNNLVLDRALSIEQEFNRTQQQFDDILAGIRATTSNLDPEIINQARNELINEQSTRDGMIERPDGPLALLDIVENVDEENNSEEPTVQEDAPNLVESTIQFPLNSNVVNSGDIPTSTSSNVNLSSLDGRRLSLTGSEQNLNVVDIETEPNEDVVLGDQMETDDDTITTVDSTVQFPLNNQTHSQILRVLETVRELGTTWNQTIQENLSSTNISSDSSRWSTIDSSSSSTSINTIQSDIPSSDSTDDSDQSDILEDSGIASYRYNTDSQDLYQWTRSSIARRQTSLIQRAFNERIRQDSRDDSIDRNVRFLENVNLDNDDIMTSGMFKVLVLGKDNKRKSLVKMKMEKTKPKKVNINATSIPEPRSGHQIANDGKYIYVFGGYDSTISPEGIYSLHETESRTTRISDRRSGIHRAGNKKNIVHNIYTEIFRFSLEDESWDRLPEHVPIGSASGTLHILQSPEQAYSNSTNTFLYIGGTTYPFDQASRTVFALEIPKEIDQYKVCKISYLKKPTYLHSSVLVKKYNCLFILGGIQVLRSGEMEFKPKLYKMDLRSKQVVKVDERFDQEDWLSSCRKSFLKSVITHFKNKLYVFGCCETGTTIISENNSKVIFIYDILDNCWSTQSLSSDPVFGFPEARIRFAYSIFKEKFIYISGGESRTKLLDSVWRIDLERMSWKFICKIPFGISFHASTITPNGKLYLFGGKTLNYANEQGVKIHPDGSEQLLRSNKMFVINLQIPTLKSIAAAIVNKMNYDKKVEEASEVDNIEAENGA